MTEPIARHPERLFPFLLEEVAGEFGDRPALLSEHECLTHRALIWRSNQYARWALNQGLAKGDTVCLLMPNRPEYMAIWLGITKVGGVAALLNTNLTGSALMHCIDIIAPKHIIASAGFIDRLPSARLNGQPVRTIWAHGESCAVWPRIDLAAAQFTGEVLQEQERRPVTTEDRALYIYTSGTTGLPKAATVSHGRIMQWSHWFAGMMDTRSTDRLYDCLPMYHSVGGVQAPGAVLLRGGSVVIRDRFSASQFWSDVIHWDCTLFQYIGELCRYLLQTKPSTGETAHRIRMACGNGLRPDIWQEFQARFQIPRIFEFYAATEGAVSLFNVEGEPGAIGRIPPFLGHRSPVVVVKYDLEKEQPIRNEQGLCVRCAANEVGEAIGPLRMGVSHAGNRFEGYHDPTASEKKVLRNAFQHGDAWFRTGDLLRQDERGFFYFIDRVGDTFRWKGENVAASEVSQAISAFPGVKQANVYGVSLPKSDGCAGMAALVLDGELDLTAFRADLMKRLPKYACPLFLRIRTEMELTTTFKYTKTELVRQGYDPLATADQIYFNHPDQEAFVRIDQVLYEHLQNGRIRV